MVLTVVDDNYENKSIRTFILNPSVELTNHFNCEGDTCPIFALGNLVTWGNGRKIYPCTTSGINGIEIPEKQAMIMCCEVKS